MKRHVRRTQLSDGREVMFFQDADSPAPAIMGDHRSADERSGDGTLRFDRLTGEWVAIATHRQSRTHLPAAEKCPLCPSTQERHTEVPASDYDVVVFENRFPSLGPGLGPVPADPGALELAAPGYGRCEVVVFTSDHNGSFASLAPARARTVIDAWADRTTELSELSGIKQVFVFENCGEDIGVTMNHPHGQIYAYPYVTPHTARTGARAQQHWQDTGRALMGDILAFERDAGERLVLETDHFSAFVPFAARWPVEVHLVPHRQVLTIPDLNEAQRDDLAHLYPEILRRIDGLYDSPTPYIAAWHQAPIDCEEPAAQWLHLQITSPRRAENKLKFLAGSEAAMGAFVSDVSAEETAARLREVQTVSNEENAG